MIIHLYHFNNTCYYISNMIFMSYKTATLLMFQQVFWKHPILTLDNSFRITNMDLEARALCVMAVQLAEQ